MEAGEQVVKLEERMEGIAEMVTDVKVEETFQEGTKLVRVHQPIREL